MSLTVTELLEIAVFRQRIPLTQAISGQEDNHPTLVRSRYQTRRLLRSNKSEDQLIVG